MIWGVKLGLEMWLVMVKRNNPSTACTVINEVKEYVYANYITFGASLAAPFRRISNIYSNSELVQPRPVHYCQDDTQAAVLRLLPLLQE